MTRQERRRASTRARILAAADALFDERGYAETSIENISEAADVAVRTVYLHFPSKAAILLAYFDGWLDAFVDAILERPVDEPVVDTVRDALQAMTAAGWTDRVENTDTRVHPLVAHLDSGPPDVAGHVFQRWMGVQAQLITDAVERGNHPADSLVPHARAASVFAAWIAAMSAARAAERGAALPANATGNSLGLEALQHVTGGQL
ncbi:TetR/AcrR family transcriptional regulator [Prescottella subtropica]|uniref:TetR/AcrR family transcriptional regulator n=1 Tax=Prescottella subtropica TaxID=2545757 RepID=UPI001386F16C|nr:TetR/AcrR family transcriptional regulator [Prescottella subtropica]